LNKREPLREIRIQLDKEEQDRLSPCACLSRHALRKKVEEKINLGHRQNFALDTDRILHSLAYSRYIDKTQVFYLIRNDHITHRVLHVQLVSKIARTVGRLLRLNEDLIEAIALGHDIGHTPFGHDGEKFLSGLCLQNGLGHFVHNIQGVRSLEKIERKGKGWNLTLQVLDGILCHNGEVHNQALYPKKDKDFDRFNRDMKEIEENPSLDTCPMTLEGCVVRMADTISYVGRDIEDAIRIGIIGRHDIPGVCRRVLGDTNGTIVYTLVEDLVASSMDKPFVSFSEEIAESLKILKAFNQDHIYTNDEVKRQTPKVELMFKLLFEKYLQDLETGNTGSDIYREFLEGMSSEYKNNTTSGGVVRDFIAGMTDEYFLNQCHRHLFPQTKSIRF